MTHQLSAAHTRHRWSAQYPPALEIGSGDTVVFECRDSSDGQIRRDSTVADLIAIDPNRVHAITGPVAIRGAEPGDTLEIHVREVRHEGWGWTGITPGLGFLSERFAEPHLVVWEIEADFSHRLPPARVPIEPFCVIIGVAPAEPGEHRTRPPGVFGGNMDVRECHAGSVLYLPVQAAGGLLSVGDVHGAQGDGEVCLRGIEMPAQVTLEIRLRKDLRIVAPMVDAAPPRRDLQAQGAWLMVEADCDPIAAARRAVSRMVDFISHTWRLTPEDAYVLCSVALDLKLSQVVNLPVHTVAASLPKSLFPPRAAL
jgi:acetamidase/formamidase